MNRRAALIAFFALASAGAPLRAQRLPRIGYLLQSPVTEPPSRERQAFLDGLRELGYVPGRTVEIVYRSAEDQADFMDDMARDLMSQKVDVVVVSGARATLAAKKATRAIPVVMLALGDPVGVGAVQSLGRPEGNVTGVSFISSDLAAKRVQLIKELVPKANGIAILWDPGNANARSEAAATIAAARSLGMAPQPLALTSDSALSDMLRDLTARKPDVLYVAFEGGLVARNRTLIAEFGVKNRVPVISGWSFMTEAGGLISYAPDIPAMFHRSAYYVHRILQGARPGQLPVEQPRKIELVLNQKTAREIGVRFSQSILLRADRVIE